MPVPDPNPPAAPPVSLDGRYEGYAYLLDDETLDRLPRVKRRRERPLNDREVLDLPDTDPRRHPTSITAPTMLDLGQHPLALRVYGPGLVTFDGKVLRVEYDDGGYEVTAPGRETEEDRLRRQLATVINERDRVRDARVEVEDAFDRMNAQRIETEDRLTAERDDARRQLVEQGQAAEEQADALRAEVARLSGLLDTQRSTTEQLRALLDLERARAERAEGLVDESVELPPLDGDPRRPRLDHYPEDAVLLTYVEVRRLLALHLEECASAIDGALAARAMRDGETPLRLAEVLGR